MTKIGVIARTGVLSGAVLGLIVMIGRGASAEPTEGNNPNAALFPRESHPYGKSMEVWAENWWRWLMSVPLSVNPNLNLAADCGEGQSGPVFFMPANFVGQKNIVRSCSVEQGKAVGVNLSSVFNDFPCPDPSFKPAPGQSLFDFLVAGAVDANGDIVTIEVSLDGVPLTDLLGYHFTSDDLLFFKGDFSLQATFDSCITGTWQPAAVDAYFIVLKPLAPGRHEITRRIVNAKGVVSGPNTVNLEVLATH